MKTAPMLLMRLLPTTVTLGFLWLVTKQGRVLEMATAFDWYRYNLPSYDKSKQRNNFLQYHIKYIQHNTL